MNRAKFLVQLIAIAGGLELSSGSLVPPAFSEPSARMLATAICAGGSCVARNDLEIGQAPALLHLVTNFGEDKRGPQTRTGIGKVFEPIGGLSSAQPLNVGGGIMREDVAATAFLVSPCYVVTNYHAVFGYDKVGAGDNDWNGRHYRSWFYVGSATKNTFLKRFLRTTFKS